MGLKEFFLGNENKNNSKKQVNKEKNKLEDFKEKKVSNSSIQDAVVENKGISAKQNNIDNTVKLPDEKGKTNKEDNVSLEFPKTSKKDVNDFWNLHPINPKKLENKTLYLFIIEDTIDTVKINDKIAMIYNMIPKDELVCFIHYGSRLFNSGILINKNVRT